jgi:hypothetical protein
VIEALVESLGKENMQRTLWDNLPCGTILRIDQARVFKFEYPVIVVKIRNLLHGVRVVANAVGPIEFSRLDLLTCGGIPAAYVVTSPSGCKIRHRSTYCNISLNGNPSVQPRNLFVDKSMGISGDSESIVTFVPSKFWIGK